MKSVLITGASGFIGSFLAEEGLKRGFTVYAGIRSTSSRRYLTDPGIRFAELDFSSEDRLAAGLEALGRGGMRPDYVIHNAGATKAGRKEDFFRVNTLYTRYFADALGRTGMVPLKFVYMSSLAAFGAGDPVTLEPVRLADEPNPIGAYGKSKLEAEKYITSLDSLPWVILRPTGVYGPREKDYYVFFRMIGRGLETYIGSDTQILTFIYVRDLARVVFDALESPVSRRAYFVTDGKEYTSRQFAEITKKVMGKKTFRLTIPAQVVRILAWGLEKVYGTWNSIPTLNTDKYNVLASRNWRCEVGPLQHDLAFRADYDLERGVSETIAWYKENRWL